MTIVSIGFASFVLYQLLFAGIIHVIRFASLAYLGLKDEHGSL